ncbi:MAG: FAA hydrolase family protein [Gammaproteobacteria bacterium]|jgi:fumarylpyruvate hydrolase|nr:FAA hydrolase family protein [Gammaproteobacteria bacterium]
MSELAIDWVPPRLPVTDGRAFPVRHVWCVGRNYAEHAREMGVDPDRSRPVFFSKPARAMVHAETMAYPGETTELHHEVELVVFLGSGGRNLNPEQAASAIFGYAVGVDLTRRDEQARAKQAGQPWEMSKGFDQSGPVGLIVPKADWAPDPDTAIGLSVDGQPRQAARLDAMIWPVPELLAELSRTVTLAAGDTVFTGTPAGVSALEAGQGVRAHIEGLPDLEFRVVSN